MAIYQGITMCSLQVHCVESFSCQVYVPESESSAMSGLCQISFLPRFYLAVMGPCIALTKKSTSQYGKPYDMLVYISSLFSGFILIKHWQSLLWKQEANGSLHLRSYHM